ncbi:hypothetical protein C8J57DRAFT_1507070 [Mycena rebaudengoi]|nr:hypothetical protein C8J57DRAFT_1507070 [Mycena rebaudengoi]
MRSSFFIILAALLVESYALPATYRTQYDAACADSAEEIGKGVNNETLNWQVNPYAGDSTPLSRRDAFNEDLLAHEGHSIPAFNDTKIRHILSKRGDSAPLKSCHISVPIAAYTSLNINGYYDLGSPATLDGGVEAYTGEPPHYTWKTAGGMPAFTTELNGNVIYGREHVYEQSMSSLFIDYLHQYAGVFWGKDGDLLTEFCPWVNENLWNTPSYMPSGTKPVIAQIGVCYPSLANSKSVGIPVLEQRANEYKQSAFYVTQQRLDPSLSESIGSTKVSAVPFIADFLTKSQLSAKFRGKTPTEQIATLRSLAMITSFMDTDAVKDAFKQTNDCIRGVYEACPNHTWYTAYEVEATKKSIKVATRDEFINTYDSWVRAIVKGIKDAVTSQMDTLILLYNGGNANAVDVKLSTNSVIYTWADLNPAVPAGTAWAPTNNQNTATNNANIVSVASVARSHLETLRKDVPDISWADSLPGCDL